MMLSEKIAYCRRKSGLSQEDLAEKLNVSRQAVSKWENGEALPELPKLRQLSTVFGVTADWLLNDEASDEPPTRSECAAASAEDRLPRLLQSLFRRFGWLAGVYIMIIGIVISLAGGAAILISNSMLRSFENNISDLTLMTELQNPSGFHPVVPSTSAAPANPVATVGTVILVFGALVFLFGIVLTVLFLRIRKKDRAA